MSISSSGQGVYLTPIAYPASMVRKTDEDAVSAKDWKQFTPETIDKSRCMARTWNNGCGGQCTKAPMEKSKFCAMHEAKASNGQPKWKVHGAVDGTIPRAKFDEFQAASKKPPKKELTAEEKAARDAARAEKKGKRKAKETEDDDADEDKGEEASEEQTRKQKKAKKDPDAPKRPAGGAFGQFLAANRPTFAKGLSGTDRVTQVSKIAGAKWKEASDADKKKYQKQYEAAQEKYKKAMTAYLMKKPAAAD